MATKFATMNNEISMVAYNYVEEMARLFSNNRTESLYYEYLLNEGIEGLQKAIDTYDGDNLNGAAFVTYMHRVVKNHLINEKARFLRHKLNIKEPVAKDDSKDKLEEGFEMLNDGDMTDRDDVIGGVAFVVKDEREDRLFKSLLLRANKGNERNAHIVELVIGFKCEPMELKEIAKLYGLSHESVRLVYKNTIKTLQKSESAKNFLLSLVG